jgi:hypothetical protein
MCGAQRTLFEKGTMSTGVVLAFAVLAVIGSAMLQSDDNTDECCPSCAAWQSDCPWSGWVQGTFAQKAACVVSRMWPSGLCVC